MFCSECGAENADDARFCGECGHALTSGNPKNQIDDNITSVVDLSEKTESVSGSLKNGVIVASLFIPIIGIIMGIVYMTKEEEDKKSVGRLWLYVGIGVGLLYLMAGSGGY